MNMDMSKKHSAGIGFMILFFLLTGLIIANFCIGSVCFSPEALLDALRHPDRVDYAHRILFEIRLPRLLAALLLGGALSVSGLLLQTFFHNPIAGPYVLGVSSSAKLAVALATITAVGRNGIPSSFMMVCAAFVGSMLSMGFILLVAAKVSRMEILVICGVIIGYFCSAVTECIITFADDSSIVNLHNWSMGSFSGISWGHISVMSVFIGICMGFSLFLTKPMSAYLLGESYAANLGVRVPVFRAALIVLSGLLTATATAFAGPISFVGMAVPHLVRRLFSTERPLILVPSSFLGGACFCLFCDLVSRTLFAPTELSISTVTSIFGAPVVIHILLSRKR